MGEIHSDLKTFKEKISGVDLATPSSDLASKIQGLSSPANDFQSQVDAYYNSSNKATILSKIGRVTEILTKISTSIENDLNSFISESNEIVKAVTELEKINNEISTQQEIVNNNSGETDAEIEARTTAQSKIAEYNKSFSDLHSNALSKLAALKSKDSNLSFVEEFDISTYQSRADQLEYGTFEIRKFTSSSGASIEYAIYIPDYGTEEVVEGLPCMLYMHGGMSNGSNPAWKDQGLTGLIEKKGITPSGIVISPHITNFQDLATLKELTDYIVNEYNCDTDKISIGGHSSGGIATYRMIHEYPDYFSCAIPISGCNYGSITEEAFKNLKVWAFGGSYEGGTGGTSTPTGKGAVKNINAVGGEATFTVIEGGHSVTDDKTWEDEYESPDGETVSVLEWAFTQEKA